MDLKKTLSGPSFLPHINPKKLIFMLHGYGDSAENFINISQLLNKSEWNANYIAFNAPSFIPSYPKGRQWFNLYPKGIYIADAGINELKIIQKEILNSLRLLENSINTIKNKYNLSFKDCVLLGFSQGGMMAFEFGNYFKESLGGLAILSGRIISKNSVKNLALLKTPIFISHGNKDEVLPIKVFELACSFMIQNKLIFEPHVVDGDTHTISNKTIDLLQNFLKKIL